MPKTKVINGTGKPLTLKEGTAGIFTVLKKLQPKESYQIVIDTNATYREYWCAVNVDDPDGGVVLSSDDCEDLKQVTIIETGTEGNTSYTYEVVSRASGETATEEAKRPTEEAKSLEEPSNRESETPRGEVETTKHRWTLPWLRGFFRKPEKGSSPKSQTENSGYSSP